MILLVHKFYLKQSKEHGPEGREGLDPDPPPRFPTGAYLEQVKIPLGDKTEDGTWWICLNYMLENQGLGLGLGLDG